MMKKVLSFVVALMMVPVLFGFGECHAKTEDLTIRIVEVSDKGEEIIRTRMSETRWYDNWGSLMTSDEFTYHDFGKLVNQFDVSVPYDSTMSIATAARNLDYPTGEIAPENYKPAFILDGGIHMELGMKKTNRNKELQLTALIPDKGDYEHIYRYASYKHIPIKRNATSILGSLEQFGDSDTDYLIFINHASKD